MRVDNADYRGELVAYCIEHGWDKSISLANERNQRPLPELSLHHPPCKSYAANQAY